MMTTSIYNRGWSLKIISGTQIKIIATIAMIIDHFGVIILGAVTELVWFPMMVNGLLTPEQYNEIDRLIRLLYSVGDMAFPLFCFLISEGFRYTHNRKKYIGRMILFAFISELPFDIAFFSATPTMAKTYPFYWKYQNVLFSYCIALICLSGIENIKTNCKASNGREKFLIVLFIIACVLIIAFFAELFKCDYGAFCVLLIVAFYMLRGRKVIQAMCLLIVYMVTTGEQVNIFVVIAALIILSYNGKEGMKISKYFFYFFYPAHITIMYICTQILRTKLMS